MVYKFFDKKTGSGMKATVNEVLALELQKSVVKNFKREKYTQCLKIILALQI